MFNDDGESYPREERLEPSGYLQNVSNTLYLFIHFYFLLFSLNAEGLKLLECSPNRDLL